MFFKGKSSISAYNSNDNLDVGHFLYYGILEDQWLNKLKPQFSQISPISKKCLSILIVIVINQVSNSKGKAHASDFSSLQQASTTLPIHSVFTAILLTTVSDLSTWVQDRAIMQVLYVWHPSNNEAISCWNTT